MKRLLLLHSRHACAFALGFAAIAPVVENTGVGRALNVVSSQCVNNARVAVRGTI